jgi:hypothetical protein
MSDTERIWIDFMKTDANRRIILAAQGTLADLERAGITLRNGQLLKAYSDDLDDKGQRDDLLVDGIVRFDEEHKRWVLQIDWDAIRHSSDEITKA